jgi:hypothetical protein
MVTNEKASSGCLEDSLLVGKLVSSHDLGKMLREQLYRGPEGPPAPEHSVPRLNFYAV